MFEFLNNLVKNKEGESLSDWLAKNKVSDFGNPQSYYDYMGAFYDGVGRDKSGHFPDTYKLPGHPTFSIESKYYQPGMSAVRWVHGKPIPIEVDDQGKEILSDALRGVLDYNAGAKK